MEYLEIGGLRCSKLVLGNMRIADKPKQNIERLIDAAVSIGVNMFDHADIYGGGACEAHYGSIFKTSPSLRDKLIIQSKCGICGGYYDLSYNHIVDSVNGSLSRLNTDRLDILLLHRPDTLMRPQEIARAFDYLEQSGKVHAFGVSNFSVRQIQLLRTCVKQNICVNQMQLSPCYCPIIDFGINVNTANASDRDGGVLEYSRLHNITIQTYGTMQCTFTDETGYFYSGAFNTVTARKKYFSLNFLLEGLAQKYAVSPEAVTVAWILKHPAAMQAVVGTTLDKHMLLYEGCCEIPLTRYEWYKIYEAAGHTLP